MRAPVLNRLICLSLLILNVRAASADSNDAYRTCERIMREASVDGTGIRWRGAGEVPADQLEQIRAVLGEEPIAIAYEDDTWPTWAAFGRLAVERVRLMPGRQDKTRDEHAAPPEGAF